MSSGFEKGSAAAEQLSALADGEVDATAAGVACGAWKTDVELRRTWPEEAPTLHRQAASWFLRNSHAVEAVRLLVEAGAARRVAADVVSGLVQLPRNALYRGSLERAD